MPLRYKTNMNDIVLKSRQKDDIPLKWIDLLNKVVIERARYDWDNNVAVLHRVMPHLLRYRSKTHRYTPLHGNTRIQRLNKLVAWVR